MKIISLIDEPAVIECILRHLGLWKQQPDPNEGKNKTPVDGSVVLDDFEDGLRLVRPTARRAGPDIKSPPSYTTEPGRRANPPPATTGVVCPQTRSNALFRGLREPENVCETQWASIC